MQAFYVEALSLLSSRFGAERPLFGLFRTDQSDEDMIASVERLNPPDMAARFGEELRRLRLLQMEELAAFER